LAELQNAQNAQNAQNGHSRSRRSRNLPECQPGAHRAQGALLPLPLHIHSFYSLYFIIFFPFIFPRNGQSYEVRFVRQVRLGGCFGNPDWMEAAMASRSVTRVMTLPLGTLATLGTSVSLHVLYTFLFSLFIYFLNIYFPRNWQSYKVPNVPKVPILRSPEPGDSASGSKRLNRSPSTERRTELRFVNWQRCCWLLSA
jgi:hypothetical protein